MTDGSRKEASRWSSPEMGARLRRRHAAERRFRLWGLAAIGVALLTLSALLTAIFVSGHSAFTQSQIRLDVFFDPQVIDPEGTRDPEQLGFADYAALWRQPLRDRFEVSGRSERRELNGLVSGGFFVFQREVFDYLNDDPQLFLEHDPLQRLARDGELAVYRHEDHWDSMDTYRDYLHLNSLWKDSPPWKVWED